MYYKLIITIVRDQFLFFLHNQGKMALTKKAQLALSTIDILNKHESKTFHFDSH